jgi:small subunit ribosomal protein S17e
MGRIKSTAIKTLGGEIIAEHGSRFTTNFDKNKKALGETREIKSKRTRNVVAGYITRKMRSAVAEQQEEA